MNFRQLKYFVAIIDEGSMLKATEILRVAQPALSQHIANLEDELGVQLLVRTPRGVVPTQAGEVLYLHAKKIAAQMKLAADDVQSEADTPKGEVAVVLPPMLSPYIAPLLVERVDQEFPEIHLRIMEALSLKGGTLVESGRVDIGLLASESPRDNVNNELLYHEHLFFVEKADDGNKTKDGQPISFRDLVKRPLIVSHKQHAVRAILEKTAKKNKLGLNVKVETESPHLLRSYLKKGLGGVVLPWPSLSELYEAGEITARPIIKPDFRRQVYLAWPKSFPLSAACQAVKGVLKTLVDELIEAGVIRPDETVED